jgi:hypothetical protein
VFWVFENIAEACGKYVLQHVLMVMASKKLFNNMKRNTFAHSHKVEQPIDND